MDRKTGTISNARFPGMMCRVYSLSPTTRITASLVAPGVRITPANAGDTHTKKGLIPGLGRSPGVENDNPLQYSRLEDSMGRGVRLQSKGLQSDTTEQLHTY